MPQTTIILSGDKFHYTQTAPSVHSVSSTASGYNKEAVRDTSWQSAWKPNDSSIDEYIQIDGGSAGWLGTTAGDTVYFAVMYDARGRDQTQFSVMSDATDPADGVTGVTFAQAKLVMTLDGTLPGIQYGTFLIPAGGKRHYRVYQYNSARGGGTKTVPIYAIAFFTATEAFVLEIDSPGNSPGRAGGSHSSIVGLAETAGGILQTNRNGTPFQEFEINFDRATNTLIDAMQSYYYTWHEAGRRPLWVQYDKLYNPADPDFNVCYLTDFRYSRPVKDTYDVMMRFRTLSRPL